MGCGLLMVNLLTIMTKASGWTWDGLETFLARFCDVLDTFLGRFGEDFRKINSKWASSAFGLVFDRFCGKPSNTPGVFDGCSCLDRSQNYRSRGSALQWWYYYYVYYLILLHMYAVGLSICAHLCVPNFLIDITSSALQRVKNIGRDFFWVIIWINKKSLWQHKEEIHRQWYFS